MTSSTAPPTAPSGASVHTPSRNASAADEQQRHRQVADDEQQPHQRRRPVRSVRAQRRARGRPAEEDAAREVGDHRQQHEREQRSSRAPTSSFWRSSRARGTGRGEQVAQARPARLARPPCRRRTARHTTTSRKPVDAKSVKSVKFAAPCRSRGRRSPGAPHGGCCRCPARRRRPAGTAARPGSRGPAGCAGAPHCRPSSTRSGSVRRGSYAVRRAGPGDRWPSRRWHAGQPAVRAPVRHSGLPHQGQERVFEPPLRRDAVDADPGRDQRARPARPRGRADELQRDPGRRSDRQRPARRPSGRRHRRAPAPARRRRTPAAVAEPTSSATAPWATSRPWCMTTTSVQVCSTSASRWLETITVRPVAGVAAQHLAHLADLRRVEPVGRLVEHQQLGQAEHGLGDARAAAACRGCRS